MSLTSFVDQESVAEVLSKHFPTPSYSAKASLKQPWQTSNYGLVGTAYDYLLRFWLARNTPTVHIRDNWVAQNGLTLLELRDVSEELIEHAEAVLSEARSERDSYVAGDELTDRLIELSLDLARLDKVYRSGSIPNELGSFDEDDIQDLRKLVAILRQEEPLSGEEVYLNPAFGPASKLVEGADGDIILDKTLIDAKATKKRRIQDSWWHQLIGYAILVDIEQRLTDADENGSLRIDPLPKIEKLGIFLARHGELWTVSADHIYGYDEYPAIRAWFVDTAPRDGPNYSEMYDLFCAPFDYENVGTTTQNPRVWTQNEQSTFDEY